MKNIFLLPTDKPSRLMLRNEKLFFFKDDDSIPKGSPKNQNIYITNDEEIKEGWVWHLGRGHLLKIGQFTEINGNKGFRDAEFNINGIEVLVKDCRKVVLTIDLYLIKDGVQAINDEFLEWFVKNPSYEKIEIETFEVEDYIGFAGHTSYPTFHNEYKIIIPKEEPKPHFLSCCKSLDECHCGKKSKQETLEEAAERFRSNNPATRGGGNNSKIIKGFIAGAKWQQERICEHNYILTVEQGHRIIKCLECDDVQAI